MAPRITDVVPVQVPNASNRTTKNVTADNSVDHGDPNRAPNSQQRNISLNRQAMGGQPTASNPISELFEDQLYTDLFNARCQDNREAKSSKFSPCHRSRPI